MIYSFKLFVNRLVTHQPPCVSILCVTHIQFSIFWIFHHFGEISPNHRQMITNKKFCISIWVLWRIGECSYHGKTSIAACIPVSVESMIINDSSQLKIANEWAHQGNFSDKPYLIDKHIPHDSFSQILIVIEVLLKFMLIRSLYLRKGLVKFLLQTGAGIRISTILNINHG